MALVECVMNIRPRKFVLDRTYGSEAAWSIWKLGTCGISIGNYKGCFSRDVTDGHYLHQTTVQSREDTADGLGTILDILCIRCSCTCGIMDDILMKDMRNPSKSSFVET